MFSGNVVKRKKEIGIVPVGNIKIDMYMCLKEIAMYNNGYNCQVLL